MMGALRILLAGLILSLSTMAGAARTPGGDFTLHTIKGEPVSLSSLQGKVVLLYFGFTFCPEMCPTELLHFKQVLEALPADKRQRVQPVFVSVDPKRDTPEVLGPYVNHFSEQILALTGSESELRTVADQYGVQFRYVPTGSTYTVDHTASVYVIDAHGKLVRILPYGTPAGELMRQVSSLLR
ncbi:MAG: SCO family protein [Rhodocyclaceae bacterium]|nr:SCO family protein [Rhodocyclaceae bacterium]